MQRLRMMSWSHIQSDVLYTMIGKSARFHWPLTCYWRLSIYQQTCRIHPIEYAYGFVTLCFVFVVSLCILLNKLSICRWFETPWRSNGLRHSNVGLWNEDLCARSMYQGLEQVITSYTICGIWLLVPAIDTSFWHRSPQIDGLAQDCSNSIANALELLQSQSMA